jgi:hypothetical protein
MVKTLFVSTFGIPFPATVKNIAGELKEQKKQLKALRNALRKEKTKEGKELIKEDLSETKGFISNIKLHQAKTRLGRI